VEIYLDPILPASRLVVFGVSPIARALVRLGKAMGYSVFAVDTALTAAEPALFPEADRVLTVTELAAPELAAILAAGAGGAGNAASSGPPGPQRGAAGPQRGGCFAVVATMGERDEEAIRAALAMRPAYLGVVASARRFAQVRRSLLARGIAAAALDSIRSPAGVAIGAQAPEEIAVSVLAEIVARRHATTAAAGEESMAAAGEESAAAAVEESVAAAGERSVAAATRGTAAGTDPGAAWTRPRAGEQGELAEVGEAGVEGEPAGAAAAVEAVDPICGMTVEVAGARHTAEAGGRTWYFCCGGCRERFLAAPERFTAAPEPAGELPRLRSGRTEGAA
jgi:xanthine dehydrogenase accessory factor